MSDSRERTDRLLDEIDELVDASLRRGDQSGSWQGERYDRCPKCSEAWHFLPITRTMYQMRLGSYAQDEFGQGIVDPDYKYQEDTSPILCPGSEWLGPPIGNREWGWYLRKSGRRPAPRPNRQSTSRRPAGVGRLVAGVLAAGVRPQLRHAPGSTCCTGNSLHHHGRGLRDVD